MRIAHFRWCPVARLALLPVQQTLTGLQTRTVTRSTRMAVSPSLSSRCIGSPRTRATSPPGASSSTTASSTSSPVVMTGSPAYRPAPPILQARSDVAASEVVHDPALMPAAKFLNPMAPAKPRSATWAAVRCPHRLVFSAERLESSATRSCDCRVTRSSSPALAASSAVRCPRRCVRGFDSAHCSTLRSKQAQNARLA